MAWSYRRRIKIIPGVHLNFSKNGISTSIGVRGANMTFGRNGTYLNTGVPGLGIYNRQKISNSHSSFQPTYLNNQSSDLTNEIFSADIQQITSQDMQGVKEAIIAAQEQREDLKKDLAETVSSLRKSKFKLAISYILIYGFIKKSIVTNLKADILAKLEAILQIEKQIENSHVALDVEFDSVIKEKYDKVVEGFKKLCNSIKIWDITSETYEDRRVTRAPVSSRVKKREVRFGFKSIPDIKSEFEPLWLKNANGSDLYFYPNFVAMYSNEKAFALISLNEFNLYQTYVRFIEDGIIPSDSKIIDRTWEKVNKNGTPDRRFRDNRQIPVVKYGEITLKTNSGLNEQYQFSNYEACEEFATAFKNFQSIIKTLKPLQLT